MEHTIIINLSERLFDFSINIFEILKQLPYKKEYDVIRYQLSKAATSIGANYEESQCTTKKEFSLRIRICIRESLESKYWLRIIKELKLSSEDFTEKMIEGNIDLIKILRSILNKSESRNKG